MTQILNDNVQVTMTIDEDPWLVTEAEVKRSRISTPDYVDINGMIPHPEETEPELPGEINNLIGAPFRLEADNELISERTTDANEDSLLFTGNLANISPIGDKRYEGIAYDPSQQGFAQSEESDSPQVGSVMNQLVTIPMPETGYDQVFDPESGTVHTERTIVASDLVRKIVIDEMGLPEENVNIELEWGGITVETERDSYHGANETFLTFNDPRPTLRKALEKARKQTRSEWWFDKEGTFNFTVPRPVRHELRLITDTDAGKTTPPYQSIRVIGSGVASQDGFSRSSMFTEDKIVLERELGVDESGETVPSKPDGDLTQPVFTYRNAEISTDAQAENVMQKLVEDLAEQQAGGKITVVGFPEINPLDGVVMPQASNPDGPNYDRNKPMGGAGYEVYEVTHRLNPSDGFITIIKAGGVIGATKTAVRSNETEAELRRDSILTSEGVVQQ